MASYAHLAFDEVMTTGKNAVHEIVHPIKNHPILSAFVATEAAVGIGLAFASHGKSVKEAKELIALEEKAANATNIYESRAYHRQWQQVARRQHSEQLPRDFMTGAGIAGVALQTPMLFYFAKQSGARFYNTDNQCLQNSPDKADCGNEQQTAFKLHEAKAMRFPTNAQCEEKTGFVCSKEAAAYRPEFSGFMALKDSPREGYPVYRDVSQKREFFAKWHETGRFERRNFRGRKSSQNSQKQLSFVHRRNQTRQL